ncbi:MULTISPECIES: 2Fe-2S iron-sulfur cluster-binding protein [unclassified Chelatococcus]|uniref:2Fe-2S iron-sulfur cluster-binding protein n=1 Tax=unclassified Chelatococcus TaxID=2638111 RepID=UPI001BCBBDA1|nr:MULTISPECIES: 2Fe-2S iron-sulfur cluster-binding protein [unclassified Chelatococcus]MBS7743505.1 2Fe-2S iron-sulfur cluster binding domain-containing protein [Chelatococcus sp. HY11]MBX3547375.1 2Fe-2S iron-sulfur cluster binding domain-containing protein [Chelatococcus sp.]CAH1662315.1 Rhodocoxin [Hyphomicrobiales bacterium]CAH1687534.1 Rhodocoxin [Hyphomicrobiales bacterium]
MPQVTYVNQDGSSNHIEATPGQSVMQIAVRNGIDGIVAECGGALMCATCHAYVLPEDAGLFPPPSEIENEMLEMTTAPRTEFSRLCCQLVIEKNHDNVTVFLPESQT